MPRVLLVDHQPLVLRGLQAILSGQCGIEVVGEVCDCDRLVDSAVESNPDVVLIDADLPMRNGVSATRELLSRFPTRRVVVMSSADDPMVALESARCGARGFLFKGAAPTDFIDAVLSVDAGGVYYSDTVRNLIVEAFIRDNLIVTFKKGRAPRIEAPPPSVLTRREREVLMHVAEGMTSRDIAEQLEISARTVEAHRARLGEKLGLRSVAELTRYALEHSLTY